MKPRRSANSTVTSLALRAQLGRAASCHHLIDDLRREEAFEVGELDLAAAQAFGCLEAHDRLRRLLRRAGQRVDLRSFIDVARTAPADGQAADDALRADDRQDHLGAQAVEAAMAFVDDLAELRLHGDLVALDGLARRHHHADQRLVGQPAAGGELWFLAAAHQLDGMVVVGEQEGDAVRGVTQQRRGAGEHIERRLRAGRGGEIVAEAAQDGREPRAFRIEAVIESGLEARPQVEQGKQQRGDGVGGDGAQQPGDSRQHADRGGVENGAAHGDARVHDLVAHGHPGQREEKDTQRPVDEARVDGEDAKDLLQDLHGCDRGQPERRSGEENARALGDERVVGVEGELKATPDEKKDTGEQGDGALDPRRVVGFVHTARPRVQVEGGLCRAGGVDHPDDARVAEEESVRRRKDKRGVIRRDVDEADQRQEEDGGEVRRPDFRQQQGVEHCRGENAQAHHRPARLGERAEQEGAGADGEEQQAEEKRCALGEHGVAPLPGADRDGDRGDLAGGAFECQGVLFADGGAQRRIGGALACRADLVGDAVHGERAAAAAQSGPRGVFARRRDAAVVDDPADVRIADALELVGEVDAETQRIDQDQASEEQLLAHVAVANAHERLSTGRLEQASQRGNSPRAAAAARSDLIALRRAQGERNWGPPSRAG